MQQEVDTLASPLYSPPVSHRCLMLAKPTGSQGARGVGTGTGAGTVRAELRPGGQAARLTGVRRALRPLAPVIRGPSSTSRCSATPGPPASALSQKQFENHFTTQEVEPAGDGR